MSRDRQILHAGIASLRLSVVEEVPIPSRLLMPDRIVLRELQIESRHPLIETERDTLILIGIAPVDLVIDMGHLLY